MADELYLISGSTLTDIGDAIRGATGKTSTIQVQNYASEIRNNIPIYHTVTFKKSTNDQSTCATYQVKHGESVVYTGATPISSNSNLLFNGWSQTRFVDPTGLVFDVVSDTTAYGIQSSSSYGSDLFVCNNYGYINGYIGTGEVVMIPRIHTNGTSIIGLAAFEFISSMKVIIIPDSITEIQGGIFKNCNNLQDVYYTGTKEQWYNKWLEWDYADTGNEYLYMAPRIHTSDGCIING